MKNSGQREEEAARRKVEEDATSPGRVFRDAAFAPEMVVIPAGEFLMGSPEDEEDRGEDEGPQHRVVIPAPFALGKYAVTFEEFDHFVRENGHDHRPRDMDWGRGDRPVIDVSWDDAVAYCRWLSKETGHDYRLPTEAEWEYTCRAGTTTPFHFGETIGTDQANYDGDYTYGGGGKGVYRKKTVPVGNFPANAFGLHDMHGNVWEWVEDCWHDSYRGAPSGGDAWTTGGNCRLRVLRGGSWNHFPGYLRSAFRAWNTSVNRFITFGFRIARTL
jgi:formylglycine-generating enzyme required for sulfatase activity